MRLSRTLVIFLIAAGLLAIAAVALPIALTRNRETPARPGPADPALDRNGSLTRMIDAAQNRLRQVPGDWSTWGQLGSAYVQQARITADPSYYPKAEGALNQSLRLHPNGNWQAQAGLGALANARHDFKAGLSYGREAEKINAHSGSVHGVIADALTQLGDYPAARAAVQKMLDVQPGVASFARASYDLEIHGQVTEARDALMRALEQADNPTDIAFCRYYLGELAFTNGDLTDAANQYQTAIRTDPGYQLALAGLAKVHAAQGQKDAATREYDQVVRALPLPSLLVEYGDFLASMGRTVQAKAQYDLVTAEQTLLASNGVTDNLLWATYLADHDQPARALTHAQDEWAARQSTEVADALAWALHRNGRDAEALTYAEKANALGWRNAAFKYHRGAIQHALGHREQARADLTEALAINANFDILQAPKARQLLANLPAAPSPVPSPPVASRPAAPRGDPVPAAPGGTVPAAPPDSPWGVPAAPRYVPPSRAPATHAPPWGVPAAPPAATWPAPRSAAPAATAPPVPRGVRPSSVLPSAAASGGPP